MQRSRRPPVDSRRLWFFRQRLSENENRLFVEGAIRYTVGYDQPGLRLSAGLAAFVSAAYKPGSRSQRDGRGRPGRSNSGLRRFR